ncbi:MAG TPA: amidohydrolase family protein [Longimicrobiales bacterium]|nr:amidohydrolase family protein [Longimicrobiales bacterium]
MTRREFLRSAVAMAATLSAIDSVAAEALGVPAGCWYRVNPEQCLDSDAARTLFGPGEFVFDIQGHLLEYDLDPSTRGDWFWGAQFPQARCEEEDPRACFSMNHFLEEMFVRSDTTMVALSGLPILPERSALPPEVMEETRRVVTALSGDRRVVVNALALPQIAPPEAVWEEMEATAASQPIHGWKTFTHFPPGMPWRLDDADPSLPQVGHVFCEQAARLDTPVVLVHKGLAGGHWSGSPADVGPAARDHPDVSFIVYHSGFEVGEREGPYSESTAHRGVNRLVTSLRESGVGPGENVYPELGSTWWHLLRRPDEAAHVVGKLLLAVGENNLLWGTDSIFYGSPQPQIDAFRAFQIPDDLQERYGYPALTREVKRKVLGANAARLYGIEPVTEPLHFTREELAEARRRHPVPTRAWGPRSPAEVRAHRLHHRGWPG